MWWVHDEETNQRMIKRAAECEIELAIGGYDMLVLTNKVDLINYFHRCIEHHTTVALFITIPGCSKPELIINQRENFEFKLDYYLSTYDDKLEHKHAPGVKIIGATNIVESW